MAKHHDDTRQPRQISEPDDFDDLEARRQEDVRQRAAERDRVEQTRAALLPGYRTISPDEYIDDPKLRRLHHEQEATLKALSPPEPAADADPENLCPYEARVTECRRPVCRCYPGQGRAYARNRDI